MKKEYKVGTNTPNDFIRKTFLKIHVKGKYVYSYDIIAEKGYSGENKRSIKNSKQTKIS